VTSSFSAIRPDPEPSNHSAGSAPCLVRSVEFKDLAKVAEILTESFHSQEGINFWLHPVFRLGIYEDLRTRLRSNSPHYICLVAIASDAPNTPTDYCPIIGTVEMGLKSPALGQQISSHCLYVSNLAVSPLYRRQGVAAQLLHRCEQIAYSWGFKDIYLHVLENNQPAKQLYFQHGYKVQYIDPHWMCWLFWRPRRMLLHKQLKSV
jgi:ribosomal protein S18 acetylase RimI-like enzyme